MQPERWDQICDILEVAASFQETERGAYLDHAAVGDTRLRTEIDALLAASERTGIFDKPLLDSVVREPLAPLRGGDRLGSYVVVEEIGHGGMGTIYKARDERIGRVAALKVISSPEVGASEKARLIREAKAATTLNHPNIVTVYEYDQDQGVDFIAMEYIEGCTLWQLLTDGPLSLHAVLDWSRQIALALSKAHDAGIIHRDLKPGNLMVTPDGVVKILDFGIARVAPARDGTGTTAEPATLQGAVIGTPAYMSPEHARGEVVDHRSDIYSFGIVLDELAQGCRQLGAAAAEIPDRLSDLIQRCLIRAREARPQSMAAVARELEEILAAESGESPRRATPARAWAAAAVLTVVASAAFLAWSHRPETVPTGAFDLTRQARAKLQRYDLPGNLDAATTLLERAVKAAPAYAPAHAALAEAYSRKDASSSADPKWRKLAFESATRAVTLNPPLAIGHTALGVALAQQGNPGGAATEFCKALDLDPGSAAALIGLAKTVAPKAPAQAAALYQRAVDRAPQDWIPLAEFAIFHHRAGHFDQAAAIFVRARELVPDNVSVRRNLAAEYALLDRPDDAAAELQRALEIQPSGPTYTNLGTIRYRQGRYADALPLMERAVELGPTRYLNWGNLADVRRRVSAVRASAQVAYSRAIALGEEALAKAPDDTEIRGNLAVYRARSGDRQGALGEARAIAKSKSRTPASLFKAAIAAEVSGNRAQSLAYLAEAVQRGYPQREIATEPDLAPLLQDARFHLATASGESKH
jgi:tetratricopeptide (TPR) repeat protein/predicted Ser/Thr protein kinase